MDSETQQQCIKKFFEGVAVEGITPSMRFLEDAKLGFIDIELRAENAQLPPIYLSIPVQTSQAEADKDAWRLEALQKLLSPDYTARTGKEVSANRVYLDSLYNGTSTYHIVTNAGSELIMDQVSVYEKYQNRVTFEEEEIEPFLRTLLLWHLEKLERQRAAEQYNKEALGDLDDHPF